MVDKNEQFLTGQSFQLTPTDYETDESEGVDESTPIGEQIQTMIAQKQDPQNMSRAERRRFEYNQKRQENEKNAQTRQNYRNYGRPKPDSVYKKVLAQAYNPRGMSEPDRNLYKEARQWYYDNNPDVVPGEYGEGAVGPLKLMSAEAELGIAGFHSVLEGLVDSYKPGGIQHSASSGSFTPLLVSLYKVGVEKFLPPPSDRSSQIISSFNPFDGKEGTISVHKALNDLAEEHDARPISQQLMAAPLAVSNVIPVGYATKAIKGGKAAGTAAQSAEKAFTVIQIAPELKATSNQNTFRTIIQSVPDAIGKQGDDALIDASKKGNDELITVIMNKPIDIEGLPANSLFEGDIRLWLMMRDQPMSLKAFGEETGLVLEQAGIKQSLDRLVELGLLNKRSTKLGVGDEIYEKTIRLDSPEAIEVLRATGMKVGVSGAGSGNSVVFGLKSFDNQVDDINVYGNEIAQKVASATGINPSAAAKEPIQKAVIAAARQQTSANELVEVTIQGQLDSLADVAGKIPVKIDMDGSVKGTGTLWQDIFSMPIDELTEQYGKIISKKGIEYIKRYQKIVDEMENLRVENGLEPLSKDRNGWNYIPRLVETLDDVKLLGKSDSHKSRAWATATEGRIGYDEVTGEFVETVYDIDPRNTLNFHMRTAYAEIIDDQIKSYVAKNVKSFSPTELLAQVKPAVVKRADEALNNVQRTKAKVKKISQELAGAKSQADFNFVDFVKDGVSRTRVGAVKLTKEQSAMLKNINKLQDELAEARAAFGTAKAGFNKARQVRKIELEKLKNKTKQDGNIFGDIGDGKIDVELWNNRWYKSKDVEALKKGVGKVTYRAGTETKIGKVAWGIGRVADAARFLQATADFGAPFIQGLPILARNPVRWTKATIKHYAAFFDPATQGKYVQDNYETFIEMAQNGIPIGDVEMFAALQRGRGIPVSAVLDMLPKSEGDQLFGKLLEGAGERLAGAGAAVDTGIAKTGVGKVTSATRRTVVKPLTKQTMGRFQNSYSMFLAYNRAELFKALKPSWTAAGKKGNSTAELANYINNLTGGLDVKGLGVSASLREIESTWLAFSPRLLRSTAGLMADAIRGIPAVATGSATARQKESLRAVAQTIAVTHGLAAGAVFAHGAAKGHSMDQIMDDIAVSQNPLSGKKYLSVEVDGEWYGVGGQIRALTQLMAGVTAAYEDPKVLKDMDMQENPLLRFYASRGSQGVRISQTVAEGVTPYDANPYEDIEGTVDMFAHLVGDSAPFVAQAIFEGSTVGGIVAGMGGLRTSPSTASDDFNRVLEDEYRSLDAETLAEYDHTPGNFPSRTKDMNAELYQKLVNESTELQELRDAKQEERLERGSIQGDYLQDKQNLITSTDPEMPGRDDKIAASLQAKGIGKALRTDISKAYEQYINGVKDIENNRVEYKEVQEFFDESEASDNEFNQALDKYFEVLQNPPLEDPVWGYDFQEKERRIEALKEDPTVAPHLNNIRNFVKTRGPQVVQDLNRDRAVMEPYFRLLDQEIEKRDFEEKYLKWQRFGQEDRNKLREQPNPSEGWTVSDVVTLNSIISAADEKKMAMRETDFLLDALLWKWEYVTTPAHPKMHTTKSRIQRQFGGIIGTNRGAIDTYLNEAGFNW